MAKTNVPKGKTRQSRRLNPDVVEEEGNATPEEHVKDEPEEVKTEVEEKESEVKNDSTEDKPAEEKPVSANTEEVQTEVIPSDVQADAEEQTKEEMKDEEGAEADAVIEVKGSAPTVSVSWEKNEQQDQEMTEDLIKSHSTEISDGKASTPEEVLGKEPEETPTEEKEDDDEEKNREDAEMETAASENNECGSPKTEEERVNSEGESEKVQETTDVEMETAASESDECGSQKTEEERVNSEGQSQSVKEVKKTTGKGKRKAQPSVDFSPSKKTKLINDGYCVYVGNLNNSKFYEDIKNALAKYFMTHSLMVQDIRLDKAKKHAFVDLASEMDLNKALALDGEKLLDKPMKVAKAKVKEAKVKVKDPEQIKQAKNERSIFVENVPFSATREDMVKVFPKATSVRFLGGQDSASKGIAFVEFQHKIHAKAALKLSKKVKIQDRALRVSPVRDKPGADKTKSGSNKIEAPPSDILFVRKLPNQVQEKHIKKVFTNAVKINIPQSDGKAKGYAFVEFESVAQAEAALKSTVNSKILKRRFKVMFGLKSGPVEMKVPSKTLIVLGLSEVTTANTLKEAFDGALSSRILMDKSTGLPRKFGFVDFESVESCTAAKEAVEDMEIDGCKVSVAFARPKKSEGADSGEKGHEGGKARSRGKRHGAGQSSQTKKKRAANPK